MPRKAFVADLAAASQSTIPGISAIAKGDEDGEIEFTFTPASGAGSFVVSILSSDVSEYPGMGCQFFLSTSSHTAPEAVNKILENHSESSLGMTVHQLLSSLASAFRQVYATGSRNDPLSVDDDGDTQMGGDEYSSEEEQNEDDGDEDIHYDPYANDSDDDGLDQFSGRLDAKTAARINQRIRSDLQAVKQAGFKVGILSGMTAESSVSLLCLSIRMNKLGLSEDTLQAWDLKKNQYVVLLIRYAQGYKSFDFIQENGSGKEVNGVAFRVGLCNRYKPDVAEAMAAFSEAKKEATSGPKDTSTKSDGQHLSGFTSMFISSSLNDFMNTMFIAMMKYRIKYGVGWDGAKLVYNMTQGTGSGKMPDALPDECFEDGIPKDKVLPELALADHLGANSSEPSFPLISMQFLMRYFLRCPEFCLICHDKTTETFEALKPYVCSRGLCLFQYMQLGFGPSIEHEILTQPYVVDLLISFCYAAAKARRIRTYPLGQFITVPPKDRAEEAREGSVGNLYPIAYPTAAPAAPAATAAPAPKPHPPQTPKYYDVKWDASRREVIFDDPSIDTKNSVHVHDWVVIDVSGSEPVHYNVVNVSTFPTIQLSETGISRTLPSDDPYGTKRPAVKTQTPATTPPPSSLVSARFSKYERQFDYLEDNEKASSIVMLLQTLPKVTEMRDYLLQEVSVKEPRLSNWTERITQSALTLLRWIVSSNRSIICQVDGVPGQTDEELEHSGIRMNDKVTGMNDWIQFRFAQGAPDKEQRFVDSLQKSRGKLNAKYPSLFAWHGSALHNWHSIIRSGLDYNETVNGRAFGAGCYFSQDLNTSLTYSGQHNGLRMGLDITWPGSQLQFNTAFAMAEIVNLPDEYTSKSPHLVVQHVDWIQCRYLFVGRGAGEVSQMPHPAEHAKISGGRPITYIEQDPQYQIRNRFRETVEIPTHAIASRKATCAIPSPLAAVSSFLQPQKKKRKSTSNSKGKGKELPDLPGPPAGYETDETDVEDLVFLTHTDESNGVTTSPYGKRKAGTDAPLVPATDFVPGQLDPSSLQLMANPSYATPMASMHLSRALKAALKVEKETPAHELGWSIDERFTDNLYQWIVELHSFDAALPLAKDMKAAGVTSIVLEIRFGKNFPISPPFIRVIRPRFLPFMSGGGGHVTAGGALCMELLTNDGWSAVNSIDSVLMQVRLAISSTDPKPARLQSTNSLAQSSYGVGEAMEAFIRACNTHGWQVPSDFKEIQASAGPSQYGMF